MKTFEGFSDWFKDSEEDKMGKSVLKKLDDIDPETIEWSKDVRDITMVGKIGKNTIKVVRSSHFGPGLFRHEYYNITINDTDLPCSKSIKQKICDKLIDMYNNEKKRQNMQKISTDLNL